MSLYKRWIDSWENRLTQRDPHRRVFPFDWGLEWLGLNGESAAPEVDRVSAWSRKAVENSDRVFSAQQMEPISLSEDLLSFTTPTPSPFEENNRVRCRIWKSESSRSAVIVIPQWNADAKSHVGLCELLNRFGLTAVRITLPYHETRAPGGMKRADLMVSPNIGRTLHATRQAVVEVLTLARWLREQGYEKVGLMGTSLGSCVGYLAFTHDCSIDAAVFNHVSAYFADVVWTGLSTRFVRWGLEGQIELDDLRECWAPLSPWYFIGRLRMCERPHLMITARYDPTFLPELSELVFKRYRELGVECERATLPCGHYTTAHFPFNYIDGWHIVRFLRKQLR